MGLGFAYTGGLLRWGFKEVWSLETHYLFGSASSNDSDVKSQVMGVRGYRHFRTDRALQFFVGPEIDYVLAKSQSLISTGYLIGGFAGMELYLRSWCSIGFDAGGYYTHLKESSVSVSDSGLDFIVNSFLNFYVF